MSQPNKSYHKVSWSLSWVAATEFHVIPSRIQMCKNSNPFIFKLEVFLENCPYVILQVAKFLILFIFGVFLKNFDRKGCSTKFFECILFPTLQLSFYLYFFIYHKYILIGYLSFFYLWFDGQGSLFSFKNRGLIFLLNLLCSERILTSYCNSMVTNASFTLTVGLTSQWKKASCELYN